MASGLRGPRLRLAGIPLVAVAVAAVVGGFPAPALADPPAAQVSAQTAAGWLAGQLVDGERFEAVFGGQTFIDPGLTIDAVLAFAAAGASGDNAAKAIAWLNKPEVTANYDGDFDADPTVGFQAGSLAKLALAAEVTGKDPDSFGGVDPIAMLLSLQGANGKFVDSASFGDSVNALGQSFAVIALHRAGGHTVAETAAAAFLAGSACPDGGYPLLFKTKPADPCDNQVDATALVVQALLAAGDAAGAKVGLDWLVSQQKADGGFADESDKHLGENANSTGLAAQALRVGGRVAAADKAVTFLLSLQVGCTGTPASRSAIAYDGAGFDPSTATRATTQAILGLSGVGLAELSTKGAQPGAPIVDCPAPTLTGAAGLPVTGASLTPVVIAGVALVVVGGGLLVLLRRRRETP
jgi:LPXTG-motif cell wall-anchored protein